MSKLTFTETRKRSIVKAVIYRIFSIIGTTALSWLITRDLGKTLYLTLAFQAYLTILYFFSERAWNKISWGREVKK